ncbi:MAG: HlyD family efflux transporter periplasmic adaptor subunit [Planctomycetota bacterium]|nr:HlyD family efflux transporter periplasmic adaptor subunit [Planctomycetota bacterium]
MSTKPTQVSRQRQGGESPTTGEIVDRLSRFDGPPEQFLATLLAVQCYISAAEGGTILRVSPEGQVEVLAVYPALPEAATAPVWLAQSVESAGQVIQAGQTNIKPLHSEESLYGEPAHHHLVMVPLRGGSGIRGLAVFMIETRDQTVLAASRERLELSTSLLSLYEMRLTLQRRKIDLERLRVALETLSAVNEQDRFTGAGMALCNELASRFQCDRLSLGMLKGRYVQLKALSHTEKFSRKMKLVQDIEAAMEECLDQDLEILHPSADEAPYVARATKTLATRHGPATVVSLPLRKGGEPIGVLTAERPVDRPFSLDEIETLRLTADLSTAWLANLFEHDRWFGARLAGAAGKGLSVLLGSKHTWAKVAAVAVIVVVSFLVFARGDYKAEATFVVQAVQRRVVTAPFDGYLADVSVEPGEVVKAGQELARLSTKDLQLELDSLKAEREVYLKQADTAMAAAILDEQKRAEGQIARAQAAKVAAQIELLEYRKQQATLMAAIDGRIIGGDLSRQIDTKIATGDMLFEVAPIENLRAELSMPEDQIADVVAAMDEARKHGRDIRGELATAGEPGQRIEFIVERINPVAEVVDQQNVFKVRVRLAGRTGRMLPGMEGKAKIHIGRASYAWLWTRRLVNWLRMKLWL